LSQAEGVEMVLGLQKIIEELQEKLAIATGKNQTTSQTSSKPPSTDLLQKPEKPTVKPEADQKQKPGGQPGPDGENPKRVWTSRQNRNYTNFLNFCYR